MRGEGGEGYVKAWKTILQKKGRKLRRCGKKKQRKVVGGNMSIYLYI